MKNRLESLRKYLRWRGNAASATQTFWALEQSLPQTVSTWPNADEIIASEMQFAADHFSLADGKGGMIFMVHAAQEGDENEC